MVQRVGGYRRKSRKKLSKNVSQKGKLSITQFLQTFKVGEKVSLRMEPAYQKGNYHLRFYGSTGTVKARRGSCYEVQIKHMGRGKTVVVHPVHMRKL